MLSDPSMNVTAAMEAFTAFLNEAPLPSDLRQHEGKDYLPISFVEKELHQCFFGAVQNEVLSYKQIFNEITVHSRIRVFHPILKEWLNFDGLGASVIMQDAKTSVQDFAQFKKPNALLTTLPKALAEANKNAAKKIGKRFGSDLNRKFEDEFSPLTDELNNRIDEEEKKNGPVPFPVQVAIDEATELSQVVAIFNENKDLQLNKNFMKACTDKKIKLKNNG